MPTQQQYVKVATGQAEVMELGGNVSESLIEFTMLAHGDQRADPKERQEPWKVKLSTNEAIIQLLLPNLFNQMVLCLISCPFSHVHFHTSAKHKV